MRQLVHTMFLSNNGPSFHLWWKENLVKHREVSKYYETDCGLSHLRDHKFKHNFLDTLNPICNCGEDIETSCYYLLHCSLYTNERLAFLNVIKGIDNSILELNDSHIVEVLLYEIKFLDISSNTSTLNATIDFLLKTKRFDKRLF